MTTEHPDAIKVQVKEHYAAAARAAASGTDACCGPASCLCGPSDDGFGAGLYARADLERLPDAAVLASLGCGNPEAVAELRTGETVLDLGAGGGIDVLLSAGRVGPTGTAYGVDMTEEMLELARANAAAAGASNVEFLRGDIEDVPLPDGSVDVVISNCVINLAADKRKVFAEMFRVLRPGGRLGVSDMVAHDELSLEDRRVRGSYVGCIAGALSHAEYRAGLRDAGFVDVELIATHEPVPGIDAALVRARKPA
ncbi:MAG TPA: arsenite methyltransferase [Actinomycetota bacterium]|nr:arsenite methyltransferase [Actinomycetota bacterium]